MYNKLDLNDVQLKAVQDTEGPVLVIAGAGSGKTRVLTARVCHLIEKGVSPYNILAITFTNKAAAEMKERIEASLGGYTSVWISTFHSMCARILRYHAELLGYDTDFTIYTDLESERVVKRICPNIPNADVKKKGDYLWHISNAKTNAMSPEEYYYEINKDHHDAKVIYSVYSAYENELKSSNAMDFDDLLLKAVELFENNPDVLAKYQDRFHYVNVDEFQDTNTLQYKLVKMLCEKHGNIFVVGDEDQNIYSWRGAEIKNILGFPKDFEGAKVYKLEQNYRSATGILDAANNVIKNNVARNKKNLWSEFKDDHCIEYFEAYNDRDEATYVSRQINWLVSSGREYRDIAILVRANSLTRLFEEDFNLHGIPYKVFGGFRFFERKEIKDTLAYVRLALNPSDNDSLLRIINYPSRGIGAKSVEELKQVATDNNMTLFSVLINPGFLNPNTAKKLAPFLSIAMDIIDKCKKLPPVEFIQYVIRRSGIEDNLLQAKEDDDAVKLENVHQLVSAVENFVKDNQGQEIVDIFGDTKVLNPTISDFMQSVALVSDSDEMDGDNYVTIATVHAVKGLEFDTVFIIGLEEGIFPVNRALQSGDIEEERRLMYVAITRAKRRLYATNVRQRFRFGEYVYAPKSRFVTEMQGSKLSIRTATPIQQQQSFATAKFGYTAPKAVQPASYGSDNSGIGFDKNAVAGGSKAVYKPTSNVDYSAFKTNVTVEHKKFGRGLILSVEGEGENKTATIMFRQLGIKRFSLSIAAPHLTIVQE